MKIISIDQSFTNCAWCIAEWEGDGNITLHDVGVIHSNKGDNKYKRAEYIAKKLIKIVKEHQPEKLIIEQIAFGGIGNAAKDLAGLLYVILVLLKNSTHLTYEDFNFVTATGAKKTHTGDGRADKKKMLEHVPQDVVNFAVDKGITKTKGLYDVADAYAFAVWLKSQK